MPFGLHNAPATFQQSLDLILSGLRFNTCLVYLDELLILLRNLEDHVKHIDEVLTLLENTGFSLKHLKCKFFRQSLDYRCHVLFPGRISIATDSTSIIADAKFSQELTQRRSFLGACNIYCRFIKGFSHIVEPLKKWMCKDVRPVWQETPEDQLHAFQSLKQALVEPLVLGLLVMSRPLLLVTDSSTYQIGVTLLQ